MSSHGWSSRPSASKSAPIVVRAKVPRTSLAWATRVLLRMEVVVVDMVEPPTVTPIKLRLTIVETLLQMPRGWTIFIFIELWALVVIVELWTIVHRRHYIFGVHLWGLVEWWARWWNAWWHGSWRWERGWDVYTRNDSQLGHGFSLRFEHVDFVLTKALL